MDCKLLPPSLESDRTAYTHRKSPFLEARTTEVLLIFIWSLQLYSSSLQICIYMLQLIFLMLILDHVFLQYFMHFTFQLKNWPNRKRMPAGNLILPQDSICHINLSLFNPTFPILLVTAPFTHAQSIILLFCQFIFQLHWVSI